MTPCIACSTAGLSGRDRVAGEQVWPDVRDCRRDAVA